MDNYDPSMLMSTNSLANTFMSHFKTDSLALDYAINFMFLSIFGWITTVGVPRMRQWLSDPRKGVAGLCGRRLRPQLRFTAKKATSSWQTGVNASVEYRAWMARIRQVVQKRKDDVKKGHILSAEESGLMQLQEFTQAKSIWDNDDDEGGESHKGDRRSEWMPDQAEPFKVSDKIFCEFHTTNVEESRGDNSSSRVDMYTLEVYTTSRRDCTYLLNYHNDLMQEFYDKARLTLQSKPHIFELQGVSESEIQWDQHEFSSTRRMQHVWFKTKQTFLQAYDNFMNNRAEYERRGDPWTFNVLLYGTPGCGKTSLLKALVNDSVARGKMTHVFVISFSKIKDTAMLSRVLFSDRINGHFIPFDQRMLIFEDFDCGANAKVFKKRFASKTGTDVVGVSPDALAPPKMERGSSAANVALLNGLAAQIENATAAAVAAATATGKSSGDAASNSSGDGVTLGPWAKDSKKEDELTLSGVLNILDGINERTGQRCFWTTNAAPPEAHFDAAFLRPGRMDMQIDFTKCNQDGISYLVAQYFRDDPSLPDEKVCDPRLVEQVVDYKWSPAEVKQRCKESSSASEALHALIHKFPTQH